MYEGGTFAAVMLRKTFWSRAEQPIKQARRKELDEGTQAQDQ